VPGLYAPMIHPWSSTSNLPATELKYLYWNLSTWGDYEVREMRTDLSKISLGATLTPTPTPMPRPTPTLPQSRWIPRSSGIKI